MGTLHMDLVELRWLYVHLASDERLIAQKLRDRIGREIARWEDIHAYRNGQQQHVARAW